MERTYLFCALLAGLIVKIAGLDPLTAYLAASPGGIDTIAIVAMSTPGVDVPFVMAMHTARFVAVLLIGPPLARFVVRRMTRSNVT